MATIPIREGQPVAEWGVLFRAQTASLTDAQQRAMLPAFVNRSRGEQLLATEAAKKDSLKAALEYLSSGIDGDGGEVAAMRSFMTLKRSGEGRQSWIAFLMELRDSATRAGLGTKVAVMRFIASLKDPSTLGKLKDFVKDGLTVEEVIQIVDTLGVNLSEHVVKVKEEPEIFTVTEGNGSPVLKSLARIEEALSHNEGYDQEASDQEECMLICFGCGKQGHIQRRCKVTCETCGKKGHISEKCYKNTRKQTKKGL